MAANSLISTSIEHPPIELLSLLILDDERAVREGCRDAAVSLGYQTFVAENSEAAYKLLETHGIDVVMLDFKVSGSGGFELLREVKRRRPQAEVIVITSNATVESAVQAMKYGAYDYVTKPFDLDELKLLLVAVRQMRRTFAEPRKSDPDLDAYAQLYDQLFEKLRDMAGPLPEQVEELIE